MITTTRSAARARHLDVRDRAKHRVQGRPDTVAADVIGGVSPAGLPVLRLRLGRSARSRSAPAVAAAAQAATVVMVSIDFQALPTDNWNANGRAADFTGSVVLRSDAGVERRRGEQLAMLMSAHHPRPTGCATSAGSRCSWRCSC